jgi:soluble lytic murein transglycosylase-like protein
MTGLTRIAVLAVVSAMLAFGSAQSAEVSAEQAYREVLSWASGSTNTKYLDDLYEAIERIAYRHSIVPEFALAVVASEARYGSKISFARWDSWQVYQKVTGRAPQIPSALDDLETSFSELKQILDTSGTVEEVYMRYWSGKTGAYNAESLKAFSDATTKIYAGLQKFAQARAKQEAASKYRPKGSDLAQPVNDDPVWSSVARGDLAGYSSKLGSMPKLAAKLKDWPGHEEAYAARARSMNKNLSHDQSIIIARAILSYCHDVDEDFQVLDPRLVMAVVAAESRFKCSAVSRCGALGLGQLMPGTARGLGIRDPLDPIQNLYGCVKYLEREMYRWRGKSNQVDLVLASYNAGPGAVQKYGGIPPYKETQSYVRIVKKYYKDFKSR